MRSVRVKVPGRVSTCDVHIGRRILDGILPGSLKGVRRVVIVSNSRVYGLYGHLVERSLRDARHSHVLIGDGERFKTLRTLQQVTERFADLGLTRTDAVIGLGGGVVGDVAGLAASVYQRGVGFMNVPTTLLAMIDASVGGKNGVNTAWGKNQIGTIYQPFAVLIDAATLETLPRREISCGLWEALKHGVVAGRRLFEMTAEQIAQGTDATNITQDLLAAHVRFKASIVRGDACESPENITARSRKVLNFGHTFGHALEKACDYKRLRHGEAVGYGILFAAELSKKLGLLDSSVVKLLYDVVHRVGKLPPIEDIETDSIRNALRSDKKSAGGVNYWILLKDIGKPQIVPHTEVPERALRDTIDQFVR